MRCRQKSTASCSALCRLFLPGTHNTFRTFQTDLWVPPETTHAGQRNDSRQDPSGCGCRAFLPPRSAPSCPPSFQTTGRYPCNRKYRIRYLPSGMQTPGRARWHWLPAFLFCQDDGSRLSDPRFHLRWYPENSSDKSGIRPFCATTFSPLLFSCSFCFYDAGRSLGLPQNL